MEKKHLSDPQIKSKLTDIEKMGSHNADIYQTNENKQEPIKLHKTTRVWSIKFMKAPKTDNYFVTPIVIMRKMTKTQLKTNLLKKLQEKQNFQHKKALFIRVSKPPPQPHTNFSWELGLVASFFKF